MRRLWPIAVILALCVALGVTCYDRGRQAERADNAEDRETALLTRAEAREDSIVALTDSMRVLQAREDSAEAARKRREATLLAAAERWRAIATRAPTEADSLGLPPLLADSLVTAGNDLAEACFAYVQGCDRRVAIADSIQQQETARAELYKAQATDLRGAYQAALARIDAINRSKLGAGVIGAVIGAGATLLAILAIVIGG